MDDFEPVSIGISDEERRRREAQQRRDDEARAAALRAMQQLDAPAAPPMQAPALPRASSVMAEARGEGPAEMPAQGSAEPYRGEDRSPYASLPRADVRPSGAVVLPGAPAQRPPSMQPPQEAPPRRIQLEEPIVIGPSAPEEASQQPAQAPAPEMPAQDAGQALEAPQAPRRRAQMPAFDVPAGNPMQAAAEAVGRVEGQREEAGALARWDQRIRTLQQIHDQERDGRRRSIIAALIGNLITGAMSSLAGSQRPAQMASPRFDALEERASRRLSDAATEWTATDRAVAGAAEMRQARRAEMEREQTRAREREGALDVQRGQLDIARMREERAAEQAEAQRALTEARTSREQIEARRRLAATDASSEESRRARTRYVLSALPRMQQLERGRSREDLRAELEEQVREMSAYDVERLEGELPSMTIGTRTSRAGGGGASSGQRSALVAEAIRLGVPEAAARTMSVRDLDRELLQRTRRGAGDSDEGRELLPGVRAGIGLEAGEARAFRQDFSQMRSQYGALGEVERVAGRYGSSALVDRRAAGEMAAPLTRLRAMVAQLQNTGIINPSEAPAIEAMLPNPASLAQMTFGDLQARLGSFRGELDRAVDAQLAARGVDDTGRAEALRQLHGAARGRAGAQQSGGGARFRISRDGQSSERALTPEQRRRVEAAGYTVEAL